MLSASGALLVIYQVVIETKLERQHQRDRSHLTDLEPVNLETAERVMAARTLARHSRRLGLIIGVSVMVFIGEVLHAWADYIIPPY